MITISNLRIEDKKELSYLLCDIQDDVKNKKTEVWFSVSSQYKEYLCTELADAFLLGLLPIAVKHNQDITVDAAVSPRLLYNLRTGIEPMYQKIFKKSGCTKITVRETKDINFNGKGVATGCSLGVDSLSAIYSHLEKDIVDEFKLTHLTLFNSGQLGDYDLEASEQNFLNNVEEIKPFAESLNLNILAINSNFNSLYKEGGMILLHTFVTRTMAFAMSVQKLIKYYIYASSHPVDKIKFGYMDSSYHEAAFVSLLTTESFLPVLADQYMTRVDKTAYIRTKPYVSKYLKVCWAEQTAYEVWQNTTFLEGKTKTNCGWCDKCLRTLLTLEVLNNGNLDDYKEQFELKKYYQHRDAYIKKIFAERKKNSFYQEMVDLIIEKEYPIDKSVLRKYRRQNKKETQKSKFRSLLRRIINKILRR